MFRLIHSSWPILLVGGGFAAIALMALVSVVGQVLRWNRNLPQADLGDMLGTLIVLTTFSPVAVLSLLLIWWYWKECRSERKLRNQHPQKPWLHRSDWADNSSRHFLTPLAVACCGVAVAANSLTIGGFAFFMFGRDSGEERLDLLALSTLFAGFISITFFGGLYVLSIARDAFLYRGVTCQLIASPFQPGDAVRSFIRFDRDSLPQKPITVTLECSSTSRTRPKVFGLEVGDSETFYRTHFQSGFIIDDAASHEGQGLDLPVRFNLPSNVPETGTLGSVTWDLSLRWHSVGGLSHSLEFQIPVYRVDKPESPEEAGGFDQLFSPPNGSGFARFGRPVSLKELIESHGGSFNQRNDSEWELCLPAGNYQGIFGYVVFGGCALVFLGGGLCIGGMLGAGLAALPWISLLAIMRGQKLHCDGLRLTYRQESFWGLRAASVDISDVKSISHHQKERSNTGVGVHQVTAELLSGRGITLLPNAHSLLIAAAVCKRLRASKDDNKGVRLL